MFECSYNVDPNDCIFFSLLRSSFSHCNCIKSCCGDKSFVQHGSLILNWSRASFTDASQSTFVEPVLGSFLLCLVILQETCLEVYCALHVCLLEKCSSQDGTQRDELDLIFTPAGCTLSTAKMLIELNSTGRAI